METHIRSAIRNRERLKARLGNTVVVLEGRSLELRTRDCPYPFRQDSDFLFLSGASIPECRIVITPGWDALFIPRPDRVRRVWEGIGFTARTAKEHFGFDRVHYLDVFHDFFSKLRGRRPVFAPAFLARRLRKIRPDFHYESRALLDSLASLRMQKTPEEIRLMQHAATMTSRALIETLGKTRPGMFEYQIEALFDKALRDLGIRDTAFPTIVASGADAAILHYTRNRKRVKRKDLCLVDCGGEYHGYAADISRTFPVGGLFSKRQKDVYRIVEKARRECVALVQPGVRLKTIHEKSVEILCGGLRELGILKGSRDEIHSRKSYALFYPHGVSHPLGLDAHDVFRGQNRKRDGGSALRADMTLQPGMVITVEPGLYFNRHLPGDSKIRSRHAGTVNWKGLSPFFDLGGVRIEDDVAVTSRGAKVLSRVPTAPEAIEALLFQGG